jgi:hypothetical protein
VGLQIVFGISHQQADKPHPLGLLRPSHCLEA